MKGPGAAASTGPTNGGILMCLAPERRPGLARSLWARDFTQEGCHAAGPGDCEGLFIRAGDSETRKGLGKKNRQERDRVGGCFGSPET